MGKQNILTDYYYKCAVLLKEYLVTIPELKLTNAKSYFGQIEYNGETFTTIRLSKWNLVGPEWILDDVDIIAIIETICHEFAHMNDWEHSEAHQEITTVYTKYCLKVLHPEMDNVDYLIKHHLDIYREQDYKLMSYGKIA